MRIRNQGKSFLGRRGKRKVEIESNCSKVQQLGQLLDTIGIFSGILKNRGNPIFEAAISCELHAGCLVPIGIVKALEVSAGLALPKDASIKVSSFDLE